MSERATMQLAAAADRVWDILVVGAGPAGAMAAGEAARRGARVVLLDRAAFPRPKVCGCCLGVAALEALRAAGLGDLPAQCGARPLEHMDVRAGGRRAQIRIPRGAVVSRRVFDTALLDSAIDAGAEFIDRCPVTHSSCDGDVRRVTARRDTHEATLTARIVVLAGGLRARPAPPPRRARRVGVAGTLAADGSDIEPGVVGMACGNTGYVGWVRLEDDRVRVAAALDPRAIRRARGVAGAVRDVLATSHDGRADSLAEHLAEPLAEHVSGIRWWGTPPLAGAGGPVAAERLLLVGDAAGYVEPFTGEGIGWALVSGRAVAPIAVAAAGHAWTEGWGNAWRTTHRRLLAPRHRACTLVTRALRVPAVTRAALATAGRAPGATARIVAAFCGPPASWSTVIEESP